MTLWRCAGVPIPAWCSPSKGTDCAGTASAPSFPACDRSRPVPSVTEQADATAATETPAEATPTPARKPLLVTDGPAGTAGSDTT